MKSVITKINGSVLQNSPKSERARLLDQKVDDPCLTIEVEENQQLHVFLTKCISGRGIFFVTYE